MFRFLIELLMFGCTIYTIIHFAKIIIAKKKKSKKTPKLSDLKGQNFTKFIDDLTKDLH